MSMLPDIGGLLRNLLDQTPLTDGTPSVGPEVTATPVVEATATPIPVAPAQAPLAAASPWQPQQWLKPAGWTPDFHGFFLFLFLVIAVAAVVGYFYFFQRRFRGHKLHARLAERVSMILTAFAAVGLLLLLAAQVGLGLLSWPLWLIVAAVVFLATAFYGVYYYASVYPLRLAAYRREVDRERFIPKPRTKGPAQTPPMKKKQQKDQKQRKQKQQKRS